MQTREVEYAVDGTVMLGRLVLPEGEDKRPAVLVAHEAGGLDEHELGRARRLAELGYVVLAIDYYGSRRVYTDPDEMMAQLIDLGTHPNRMRAIGRAALEVLTAEPRVDSTKVAAIGYCFGVVMMLELARDHADLKAVVGFHPGSADHDPADSRKITGKVLVCIGSEDPLMPAAERMAFEEEMRVAGVDWQMNLYGGAKHSFTNPNADQSGLPEKAYHKDADARSWRAMIGVFDEVFAPLTAT
jgi:dienelactone hydrolase